MISPTFFERNRFFIDTARIKNFCEYKSLNVGK